jgi:hypothetical protein
VLVFDIVVFIGVAPILGVMAIQHDIAGVASNWASRGGIQSDLPLPCPLPFLIPTLMQMFVVVIENHHCPFPRTL